MADTESQIGIEQLGLGSVLKRYTLIVPPNQRDYAWEEQEVQTLLEDFARAIAEGDTSYFLGTIVTIPRGSGVLEVVDGQQRLSTTAIFLATIRDYLSAKEKIIAEALENDFLTVIDRKRRERVPRLTLNLDDNDYFKAKLSGSTVVATRASHRRISEAFDLCARHVENIVSGHSETDHGDVLERWISFVEHSAHIVLLRVSNDANAYKMFETLNDRGLKTSQSDLVKNYLFGRAGDRLPEVQQKWALMRGALESLDNEDTTVDFLRHALIATQGYVREADVYERVQTTARSPQLAVKFSGDLENLSGVYVALHNPEHERWNAFPEQTRRAIEIINLFNVRPMRPLMLAIADKFSSGQVQKAFQLLITMSVRLLVAGSTRSGTVETRLASAAHKVTLGELKSADDLLSHLREIIPGNQLFKEAFTNANVGNARVARYYLRALELTEIGDKNPALIPNPDQQVVNLEHVLPKKPLENWPQFTPEDVKYNVSRLGNQTLLLATENGGLNSDPFSTKKAILEGSVFALTRLAGSMSSWTPKEIATRQAHLADLAVRTWPI